MPKAEFKITGEIADFTRLDNVYRTLKREAEKLLNGWTMNVEVTYQEQQGEKPGASTNKFGWWSARQRKEERLASGTL